MKLADYIDTDKLRKHINAGIVTTRRHNTLPLTIYCYGKKAIFDQIWDDVTTKTRGLIVDDSGEIIALPYEKFFAVGQHPNTHPLTIRDMDANFGPPIITEKVNGCLGIFWRYGIHWGIASKGSFHSPHAEFATKWMEDHIEKYGPLFFPEGYTPVFEIICQEIQPHVIKYEKDGLVLLSFVKITTGEELDRKSLELYADRNSLKEAFLSTCPTLEDALTGDTDVFEGYVATYNLPGQAPFKLKIKFPTFLKNRKAFYEEQRLKAEPAKTDKYVEIFNHASTILRDALVSCTTRKEFAEFFNTEENKKYSQICFAMMDEHDYKKAIWRLVEKENNASIHP
jgi:RNA ligase